MALTRTEKLVKGLRFNNYVEMPTASKRYRRFRRDDLAVGVYMWVGNSGALRRGSTAAGGMSLTNTKRYRLLIAGCSVDGANPSQAVS